MPKPLPYVFVTVGTTRFDELVDVVLNDGFAIALLGSLSADGGSAVKRVVVQAGNSVLPARFGRLLPTGPGSSTGDETLRFDVALPSQTPVSFEVYRFKPSIADDLEGASLVISHAGAGSVFESLRANKPLVVVVNDKLADNHQTELADAMSSRGHCFACEPSTLLETIETADFSSLKPLPSAEPGLKAFSASVDEVMGYTASAAPASSASAFARVPASPSSARKARSSSSTGKARNKKKET